MSVHARTWSRLGPGVHGSWQGAGPEARSGGLRAARLLEPYGMLWIHMALDRKAGRDNAFAYLARGGGSAG